jgi:acyl carrier protein
MLDDLIAIVQNFNGKTYSGPIDGNTYFFQDLGMTSIDAVVLSETLQQYYGQKIPFSLFLKGLKERKVDDLQLGELAAFLSEHIK